MFTIPFFYTIYLAYHTATPCYQLIVFCEGFPFLASSHSHPYGKEACYYVLSFLTDYNSRQKIGLQLRAVGGVRVGSGESMSTPRRCKQNHSQKHGNQQHLKKQSKRSLKLAVAFIGHRCHKLFREGSCKSPYSKSVPIHPSDSTINPFCGICLEYVNQLAITD